MENVYKLKNDPRHENAEILMKMIQDKATHRYARIALRIAYSFLNGDPYGRDLHECIGDVHSLTWRFAEKSKRMSEQLNRLRQVNWSLQD